VLQQPEDQGGYVASILSRLASLPGLMRDLGNLDRMPHSSQKRPSGPVLLDADPGAVLGALADLAHHARGGHVEHVHGQGLLVG
jgi:hypothetical protein